MSYDLAIWKSEETREVADAAAVAAFIAGLPGIQPNGEDFVYAPNAERWMEINLEYLDEEAEDRLDEHGDPIPYEKPAGQINRVTLNIPYGFLTPDLENLDEYVAVARQIARRLNWRVFDHQTGEDLTPVAGPA